MNIEQTKRMKCNSDPLSHSHSLPPALVHLILPTAFKTQLNLPLLSVPAHRDWSFFSHGVFLLSNCQLASWLHNFHFP